MSKQAKAEVSEEVKAQDRRKDGEPVRLVVPLGEVSQEKAKEVNGYKGYDNVAEAKRAQLKDKNVDLDQPTDTGAKYV